MSRLGFSPLLEGGSGNEILVNEALFRFEAGVIAVKDFEVDNPPGSPVDGDAYVVGTGTGDWSGQDGNIAFSLNGWVFLTPKEGLRIWVDDSNDWLVHDGTNWLGLIGSGTQADAQPIVWDHAINPNVLIQLTGDRDIDPPIRGAGGAYYTIGLQQDTSPLRSVTWDPVFKFEGGTAPTLTNASNAIDIFHFVRIGSDYYEVNRVLNVS